jgi:hypothetical protein
MWPMQVGTDFTQFEMIALEEAKIVLCGVCKCVPRTLFVNESTTCNRLANPKAWPETHNNKPIWRATTFKLSMHQINIWEVG